MKINEYRKYSIVTMADLGSNILNSVHMVLGIATELLSELCTAIENNDVVNIAEEIADANWYLANYCNIWNIETPDNFPVPEEVFIPAEDLFMAIGELQDLDKKELAYGKIADLNARKDLVHYIWSIIEGLALGIDIDTDEARKKNIEKLRARYGDKFDAHKATNRDLVKEREILEA